MRSFRVPIHVHNYLALHLNAGAIQPTLAHTPGPEGVINWEGNGICGMEKYTYMYIIMSYIKLRSNCHDIDCRNTMKMN